MSDRLQDPLLEGVLGPLPSSCRLAIRRGKRGEIGFKITLERILQGELAAQPAASFQALAILHSSLNDEPNAKAILVFPRSYRGRFGW